MTPGNECQRLDVLPVTSAFKILFFLIAPQVYVKPEMPRDLHLAVVPLDRPLKSYKMEITLTAEQFMALQLVPIEHPVDTRDDARDLRNLPGYIAAIEKIVGKNVLNQAFASGEPISIHVDWSRS
jgi:hypothetical protein